MALQLGIGPWETCWLGWIEFKPIGGVVGAGMKCRGDASRRFSDLRMTSEFRWPCMPEAEGIRSR